jgi:NitT/TauT family transport system permease protein
MKKFTTFNKNKSDNPFSKKQITLSQISVVLFWFGLWELASMIVGQELLIASPGAVFKRLFFIISDSTFYEIVFYSMSRIMAGFLLALICGILLAVLTSQWSFAYQLFAPIMGVIKATPVASFIILALIWLKAGGAVTFSVFLMVVPMVWSNLYQGIQNTDPQLLEMGRVFRFSRYKMVRWIYIPAVLPYFISTISTGLGFAWKAGVAAEVLGTPKHSIGQSLSNAKIYLETADLFAWTLIVIILSILLEKMVLRLLAHLSSSNNKI